MDKMPFFEPESDMDYEFQRDLMGRFEAHFSMGHEALGNWLTQEISDDKQLAQSILQIIRNNQGFWQYKQSGKEYDLLLTHEEAEVRAHALEMEDEDIPEELEVFDAGSIAHCGLDDFIELLEAWTEFI